MTRSSGLPPSLGLLLLSTLTAIGWLLPDLFPHFSTKGLSIPWGQAILFSFFAAMASSIALARKYEFPKGWRALAWPSIGVSLFVIPAIAVAFAQGQVSNFDQVAVLCLTPLFALVLDPHLQQNAPRRIKAGPPAALIAIAGILCLFPLETPASFRAAAALLFLVVTSFEIAAANCIAVRLATAGPTRATFPAAAQAGAAVAIAFALLAALTPATAWNSTPLSTYLLRLIPFDIPALFLLFLLFPRLAASRMTARFLLAPLFASVLSLFLEQTFPSPRAVLGMALLAAGSGWLVFAPDEHDTEKPISLTSITPESPSPSPRGH